MLPTSEFTNANTSQLDVDLLAEGQHIQLPSVELLRGGSFTGSRASGRPTVLYWWASWCPVCMIQTPHIEALCQTNKFRGLQLLGLSIDETDYAAADYLRKQNFSFPST
jgi:thiol-disulfide isomerase/thioredoxin